MTSYGFDTTWEGERDRMALAEAVLDPVTTRQLESLGVREGWGCLEVGAGAGSIARWLCQRVGPSGRVLATDIDPGFLDALTGDHAAAPGEATLEVRRHDIVADEPIEATFGLAHARLVLQHLPGRDRAVAQMAGALVPGGWVLAEELDFVSSTSAGPLGARAFDRVERAIHRLLSANGFLPDCGRRLPALLRRAGLVDVEATGALSVVPGGSPMALWYRRSIDALRPRLVTSGYATEREVERAVALLEDPDFSLMTPVLVSARGRRPS